MAVFRGGLLLFLPVCCRDRAERVLAVRTIKDYGKSTRFAYWEEHHKLVIFVSWSIIR